MYSHIFIRSMKISFYSSVLTLADESNHVDKEAFQIPFVCGARDLGEALRRMYLLFFSSKLKFPFKGAQTHQTREFGKFDAF